MSEKIAYEEDLLLRLLANALFEQNLSAVEDNLDQDKLLTEAEIQTVTAITYEAIRRNKTAIKLDKIHEKEWERKSRQIIAQNMVCEFAHSELHELLSSSCIPYVILKGCASASYYPVPCYRAMGDVDFLVEERDRNITRAVLADAGYQKIQIQNLHHEEYQKDRNTFELHYVIGGLPDNNTRTIIERYLSDTIATAIELEVSGGKIMVPDCFHHGLIMLLHMARHMVSYGMGLRHLCDWAVYVNSVDDFQGQFEQPLREMGLWEFAKQITALSCRYLGLPNQDWCGRYSEQHLRHMMLDILTAGNMGRKKENNAEHWLTSNISSGGLSGRSMAGQFIKTLNDVTILHWPKFNKIPVLLPLGWFVFGARYLVRTITGQRPPLHVLQDIRRAKNRRKLYRRYQLFEVYEDE